MGPLFKWAPSHSMKTGRFLPTSVSKCPCRAPDERCRLASKRSPLSPLEPGIGTLRQLALAGPTWALQVTVNCLSSFNVDLEGYNTLSFGSKMGHPGRREGEISPPPPPGCATEKSQRYRSTMFLAVRRAAILESFGTQTHTVPHIPA